MQKRIQSDKIRDDVEKLIHDIEDRVYIEGRKNKNELSSSDLGNEILKALHDLDKVAYIRFASVYKEFKTVHEFIEAIENL